jgi:hypothetical protein
MKKISGFIFYVTISICFSCEEQVFLEDKGWFVKCAECQSTEPQTATLVVRLEGDGAFTRIDVYEGELEDSVLYRTAQTTMSKYSFTTSLNKIYTVTATYFINSITYIAVDSAIPRVKYTKDQCDDPCYFVYDRIVDLRLKYTAN